jgi:ATP-binding cassette subfamily C protein
VTLWDPSIPDDAVIAALKDAAIYDAVSSRSGGLHSRVEQDGRNFSGGQRQRLEIARALVRQPSVLVLDEATSALEAEAERVISDNLRRRGCACLVIAHRLSTVRDSDEILGELSGEIEAHHLSFRYDDDGPAVLDDVSFHVLPGEFVAVVGGSGSGKSTLLRLLIGFDEPTSGTVLYDGQDLAGLDQAAVRRQCGVVLQNAQPFTGSILDCIRGSQTASLDDVWEAAEMSGLARDIRQLPMGLHTVVSAGGGTLSGGQRQRLMIAQALVRRPRILFFDEATSALDNETQRIVTESTRKLRATRVVIAHRLSTVMDADRVFVMDQGRIVQQGTPAELRSDTAGLFHQLVRRQL